MQELVRPEYSAPIHEIEIGLTPDTTHKDTVEILGKPKIQITDPEENVISVHFRMEETRNEGITFHYPAAHVLFFGKDMELLAITRARSKDEYQMAKSIVECARDKASGVAYEQCIRPIKRELNASLLNTANLMLNRARSQRTSTSISPTLAWSAVCLYERAVRQLEFIGKIDSPQLIDARYELQQAIKQHNALTNKE